MEAWNHLRKVALLGTDRPAQPLPDVGGPLGDVLTALNTSAPSQQPDLEGALLGAAAALGTYRRAGQIPSPAAEPPTLSDSDTLARIGAKSISHLRTMLEEKNKNLLPEWLAAAAEQNKRVSEELLPMLLSAGAERRDIRQGITHVIGKRGAWLSTFNSDWSYATGAASETVESARQIWETGDKDSRVALLTRWRAIDPAVARGFVQSTWAQDAAPDRGEFVDTFKIGLSMADEPFLESCLDDKRKEVRSTAAEWLSRLPESRLVARMIARAKPLLVFSGGKKGILAKFSGASAAKLEVNPPAECDKAMQRDGIWLKPPASAGKIGEKGYWLQAVLTSVPPDFWTKEFDTTPATLFEAARKTDWSAVLIAGWIGAAVNFKAADWAVELLSDPKVRDEFGLRLFPILPPKNIEEGLIARFRSENPIGVFNAVLECCNHTWSEAFSLAVLRALRDITSRKPSTNNADIYSMRQGIPTLAIRMHPATAIAAFTGWSETSDNWEFWRNHVNDFVSVLQFRHDMLLALKE